MSSIEQLEKLSALRDSGALTEEEFNKATARLVETVADPDAAPPWMTPFGYLACVFAAVVFVLCSYTELDRGNIRIGLLTGALNPAVFTAGPFGLYWLFRSGVIAASPVGEAIHTVMFVVFWAVIGLLICGGVGLVAAKLSGHW